MPRVDHSWVRRTIQLALPALLLLAGCAPLPRALPAPAGASAALAGALSRAGANRPELERALAAAAPEQREGVRFLVENMPDRDLRSLSASYLLENTALAYEGMAAAPWKARVPRELFLNDVLPYASLTEPRDRSRRFLRQVAAPLVAGCTNPGEAALRLNEKLFNQLDTHYSTKVPRPDASPSESIRRRKATCIGLSVLLVAACRSVGIPARVAGTPAWTSGRGNGGTHEWVEVWDGRWRFLGADEARSEGLDHAWFNEEASLALKDKPMHAIYAVSFRRTGVQFPLVWARPEDWVDAVNVTDRYIAAWAALGPRKPGTWE